METQSKIQEYNKHVIAALRVFLINAAIVYSMGFAYAVYTQNTLTMILIPIAAVINSIVVYYLFRDDKRQ